MVAIAHPVLAALRASGVWPRGLHRRNIRICDRPPLRTRERHSMRSVMVHARAVVHGVDVRSINESLCRIRSAVCVTSTSHSGVLWCTLK